MHISEVSFFSKIDFDKLDLPSGRLTVTQLRKQFPEYAEYVMDKEGTKLDAMWDMERTFVCFGYASVVGKEAVAEVNRHHPQLSKAALAKDLITELIHFGLADGQSTAKEIVTGLEKAGAAIAREQIGRPFP
jgi:hypothetical protein